jgi:hypothetical protein
MPHKLIDALKSQMTMRAAGHHDHACGRAGHALSERGKAVQGKLALSGLQGLIVFHCFKLPENRPIREPEQPVRIIAQRVS